MTDRGKLLRQMAWAGGVMLVLLVLFAHPFFAVTRPSGATVLVAEGWMPLEAMEATKDLFEEGGYTHLYVTGTLRPLAYYLHPGDTLDIHLHEAATREVLLDLDGLPGAAWSVEVNGRPLRDGTAGSADRSVKIPAEAPIRQLRIVAHTMGLPAEHPPLLFMGGLRADARKLDALDVAVDLVHRDGHHEPGRPSLAHEGVAVLRQLGIPEKQLTAVPSLSRRDRTRAAALAMAAHARAAGLEGYDVATLGVHARRTHRHYRQAAAPLPVGVIAMDDPQCRRWSWWLHSHGWFQVGKELLALPLGLGPTPHPMEQDQASGRQ